MYYFIRFLVRLALRIYCYRIRVNDTAYLHLKGPLVIASNHPNAFFDAIVLASRMQQPLHFLAWGEQADKWMGSRLLKFLHIIPVYQMQDNRSNQERNEKSFSQCTDVLSSGGMILIFSEGICENNWQLRPFKKGTARVVVETFERLQTKSPLRILPVALNYNSYLSPGKSVFMLFGPLLSKQDLPDEISESEKILLFNDLLRNRISDSMLQSSDKPEILQMLLSNIAHFSPEDKKQLQEVLDNTKNESLFGKLKKPGYMTWGEDPFGPTLFRVLILAVPALLGWCLHFLIYYPITYIARQKTAHSVFYDSVVFLMLFLAYPFYWIAINICVYFIFGNSWIQFILFCMPLLAWTAQQWYVSAQRLRNHHVLSRSEQEVLQNYFN